MPLTQEEWDKFSTALGLMRGAFANRPEIVSKNDVEILLKDYVVFDELKKDENEKPDTDAEVPDSDTEA